MEKPNLIIFTVGTSLLMGNKEAYEEKSGSVKRELISLTVNEESIKGGLDIKKSPYGQFFDILLSVNPNKQINKRGPGYDAETDADDLPAELSSLYLFYFPPKKSDKAEIIHIPDSIPHKEPKDKVALLYSPADNESIFCAYCIMKYLKEKFSGMIDCESIRIEGLDPKDKEKFEREGVRELLGEISKLINKYKDSHNIILNVTGGYKGAVPYITLFGMCQEGIEVIYLFEESKANITLPKMPVAFDIFTWRNYRGFIKTIPHLKADVAEVFLDNILPKQISGLFEEVEDEYQLTKLGEILGGRYDDEKEGELTPYGRGYLLVDKIQDDDQKTNKRIALRDCIDRWQYLWLGDLIPETVEHARGHTQRVLELAAQILYPILDKDANFFGDKDQTDNNLLTLISAIWLHDLGHSGNYIAGSKDEKRKEYELKGFPSLIRKLHHVLSWNLIDKDKEDIFKSRDNNDEWVRDTTIFSENLIGAIRLICCYHRGKMPVSQDDNKDGYVGIGVKKSLEELQSDLVDVRLMGALLRVADAGDVQEERTISENYKAMRFLQIDREKETLKKEEQKYREKVEESKLPEYLKYLKETSRKYFDGENLELDDKYNGITKIREDTKKMNELKRIKKESPDYCNDALLDYLVDNCVQKYIQGEDLKNIDAKDRIILRNWLTTLDQYVFKKSPGPHFEKHAGISAVMYLPVKPDEKNDNNEYHYNVRAVHKKDKDEEKTKKLKENAEVVLKDIFCEYKKVENILNAHRIYFDSYERMEEGENGEIKPVQFNEKDC